MADVYATQQVGVADGTAVPATKADGREVNAKRTTIVASKPVGTALNSGDQFFLGTKPAGRKVVGVRVTSDTSFGSAQVAVGTKASTAKYVAARTMTVVDTPTYLGPKASTLDDAPGDAEDLWVTVSAANIGAAVVATFEVELSGI